MVKKIEILDTDIVGNRRLSARRIYVVTTDVHVKENATLTIENGTTILLAHFTQYFSSATWSRIEKGFREKNDGQLMALRKMPRHVYRNFQDHL